MPIVKIYNMVLFRYHNLDEMTESLKGIADMGFNSVWLTPIEETGNIRVLRRDRLTGNKREIAGSLYAASGERRLHPFLQTDEEGIRRFTKTAIEFNLIPMFDLVLNHISKGSSLIKLHANWFRPETKNWDDVLPFDYSNSYIAEETFEQYWRPLIDWYINDLGFRG